MPAIRRILKPATILAVLCCEFGFAWGADPPTIAEIAAGMRQRESQVTDLRLRFHLQRERTAFHDKLHALQWEKLAQMNRRIRIPPLEAREESFTYEYCEQLPMRSWSQFAGNGSLVQRVAFDGTVIRQYQATVRSGIPGTITSQSQGPASPFMRPDVVLQTELSKLLANPNSRASITGTRDVEGEQLVDLELVNPVSEGTEGRSEPEQRIRTTINISRQYWPVHVRLDFANRKGASPIAAQETVVTGWLQSGPHVFPKRITVQSLSSVNDPRSANSVEGPLELSITQVFDVLELSVNSGIPAAEFASPFLPGEIYSDQRDRKIYEVDATGQPNIYIPRPRGLRGAVFAYHILWITCLAGYLLFRPQRLSVRY